MKEHQVYAVKKTTYNNDIVNRTKKILSTDERLGHKKTQPLGTWKTEKKKTFHQTDKEAFFSKIKKENIETISMVLV